MVTTHVTTSQPHIFGKTMRGQKRIGSSKSHFGGQGLPMRSREGSTLVKSAFVDQIVQQLVVPQHMVLGAVEVDWSDPDVQIGALGAALGVIMGIGVPIFYISRDERDEERLEELRALNRATKEATGEYMTDEEINEIRPARWTDRREFVDDD